MKGVCQKQSYPCKQDKDCDSNTTDICEGGFCKGPSWCSSSGKVDLDENPQITTYNIGNSYLVWFQSQIEFSDFSNNNNRPVQFSTLDVNEPSALIDGKRFVYSISQLLNLSEVAIPIGQLQEIGGIVGIDLVFDCSLRAFDCVPDIKVRRLDEFVTGTYMGYYELKYNYAHSAKSGGLTRDLYNQTGIKFMITSRGKARVFTIESVLM